MKNLNPVRRVKINGKYYVIAYYRGKLAEKARWSSRVDETGYGSVKKISVAVARERWKQNNSFSDNKTRIFLSNKTEVIDYSVTPQYPKGEGRSTWRDKNIKVIDVKIRSTHYQYIMEGAYKDKRYGDQTRTIYARSEQHVRGYPVSKAREECMDHFLRQLGEAKGGGYNVEDGWAKFEDIARFKEGIVYYQ